MKLIPALIILLSLVLSTAAEAGTLLTRDGGRYSVDPKLGEAVAKSAAAAARKDIRNAIPYLTAALDMKPESAVAAALYDMRGGYYVEIDNLPAALRDANEAIRLNPHFALAYQTRGRAYRRQNELQKAIADYDQAIRLNPNFAQLYVNRAVAYIEAEDYDRAMRDVDEANHHDPRLADAYINRGIIYHYRKRYDAAIEQYNKGLALKPSSPSGSYLNRALSYDKAGKHELALRDFDQSIRLAPGSESYGARGHAHAGEGKYREALADWQNAARLQPRDASTFNSIAWMKATCPQPDVRDGEGAVHAASEACRLSSWKKGGYIDTLAAAYAETGNFAKAIEQQKRALEVTAASDKDRADMEAHLALYQAGKPFRDTPAK